MARMRTTSRRSTEPGGLAVVPMRLQRFLARAGVASRRGSEDLMTAGRVTVNGSVVRELGSKVDPAVDRVRVDGREVSLAMGPAYHMLNKPSGYVTTMSDPQGRPTVAELLPPDAPAGLFPVGRLDRDVTGLLLLTTDGDLAHRLLHPSHHVWKTYRAEVEGEPSSSDLAALESGVVLEDGAAAPAKVSVVWSEGARAEVEIAIREGRKRQVKRMLSHVGHPVRVLRRVGFGPLELGDLRQGDSRPLSDAEVAALRGAAGVE